MQETNSTTCFLFVCLLSPLCSSCSPRKRSLIAVTLAGVRKTYVYLLTRAQTQRAAARGPSRPPPAGCGARSAQDEALTRSPEEGGLPRAWGRWPARAPSGTQQRRAKGGRSSPLPSARVTTGPAPPPLPPRPALLSLPPLASPHWPGGGPNRAARPRRGESGGLGGARQGAPQAEAAHCPALRCTARAGTGAGGPRHGTARPWRSARRSAARSGWERSGRGSTLIPARGVGPRRRPRVRATSGLLRGPGRRGPGTAGFPSLGGRRRWGEQGAAVRLRPRRSPGRDAGREVSVALGRGPGPAARWAAAASASLGAAGQGLGHRGTRAWSQALPGAERADWCQPASPAGEGCQLLPLRNGVGSPGRNEWPS